MIVIFRTTDNHINLTIGIGVFQNYYQNIMFPGYPASTIAWIPSFEVFFMLALVRR